MGIGTAAAVAAAAGTAISAYGAIQSGNAQSANANYQAQVAKNNQTIANQNATHALQAGEATAEEQSLQNAQRLGHIRAAIGANGVDVDTGSATDVQETERDTGELSVANTMNSAQQAAYGYRTQAVGYGAQSQLDTAEASQASQAGYLGAAGSILGGASSLGFKWAGFQGSAAPSSGQFGSSDFEAAGNPAFGS